MKRIPAALVERLVELQDEMWEGCNDRPDDWRAHEIRSLLRASGYAKLVAALEAAQAALSACGYVGYAYNEIDAALKLARGE